MTSVNYTLDDLLKVMQRLRDPDGGCPWDLRQTFQTILPHTLEEAYEVADAIERNDTADMRDELGDLLFQVIFYAQLGQEEGRFTFADIVDQLVAKLLRRHPHVFPEGTPDSRRDGAPQIAEAAVNAAWERIKAEERAQKPAPTASLLDAVTPTLPALVRAHKLQKQAATVGFDWQHPSDVLGKLEEELDELKQELNAPEGQAHDRLEGELGDLLFACVNLARHVQVKADQALRRANLKFIRRFQFIEAQLAYQGIAIEQADSDTMERFWQQAKAEGL